MESEEHGHQYSCGRVEHVSNLNDNVFRKLGFIFRLCGIIISIKRPLNTLKPGIAHRDGDEVGDDENVNEEQDEEFTVPEANTVVDPWAVMVHVKYTPITS